MFCYAVRLVVLARHVQPAMLGYVRRGVSKDKGYANLRFVGVVFKQVTTSKRQEFAESAKDFVYVVQRAGASI